MTEGTVERAGLNILGLVTNLASQHLQTDLTSEVAVTIMMMMVRMRRRRRKIIIMIMIMMTKVLVTNLASQHLQTELSSEVVVSMMMMMMMRRRRRRMRMEAKNCANISQNLLYCSPRYTSTYIGTRNFLTKPLWVYSHLKSDFFSEKKLLNVI